MTGASKQQSRYIMIGGFLGAGKTTAVAQLARHLVDGGNRVGLICNDQSNGLVDTTLLRSYGFDVAEIAGGCFCCRFDSLVQAADNLSAASAPDVFVAEPVGSCTDLVATVSYPLRRIYGDRFTIAPLSVLVDPIRAARILGLAKGRSFSSKVAYVYRKQLEEADIIVVNKCDSIDHALRTSLVDALCAEFPRSNVLCCSARDGTGLDDWFSRLDSASPDDLPTMSIDYDHYAEGEALLGWLNCTVALAGRELIDANELLVELTVRIRDRLATERCEIAHFKATLDAQDRSGNLSVISLVHGDGEPDLRESLADRIRSGRLIVNLRAEGDPETLRRVTEVALNECASRTPGMSLAIEHMEHFRPSKPTPTHRVSVAAQGAKGSPA